MTMPDREFQNEDHSISYVLAIDLGGSGPKVAVVDSTGRIISSVTDSSEIIMIGDEGAEQDAEDWWNVIIKCSKKVIKESSVPAGKIIAIACDTQWSLTVPVNEDAEPVTNAIHWMDTRGGKYNRRVVDGIPKIQGYGLAKLLRWIRLTGLAPTHSGVDSLGHVLHIKYDRPEIYQKTYKFLEPMDYLTSRLTGRITATQKSMVPFLLVDNRKWGEADYVDSLLKLTGLDRSKFPEIIENNGVVGPVKQSIAKELGLAPTTQVVSGVADSNASLIGSGGIEDFDSTIYIGTTLYMTCHVPFKKTDLTHFMTSIPSPFPGRYYLFGEQGAGGKCVEYFLKKIVYPDDQFDTGSKPEDAYERFNGLAGIAPAGSNNLIFMPWLNGSIVPCEEPNMRAGFVNMTLNTDRSHMARAIFEGLAFNSRWTMEALEKFIGRKPEFFRFAGGGARSDLWSQIHADILGVPIHQIEDPINGTVKGTALLAFHLLGKLTLNELSSLVRVKQVYEPNESYKQVYNKLYRQYRQLFKQNRPIFKALNQ